MWLLYRHGGEAICDGRHGYRGRVDVAWVYGSRCPDRSGRTPPYAYGDGRQQVAPRRRRQAGSHVFWSRWGGLAEHGGTSAPEFLKQAQVEGAALGAFDHVGVGFHVAEGEGLLGQVSDASHRAVLGGRMALPTWEVPERLRVQIRLDMMPAELAQVGEALLPQIDAELNRAAYQLWS